MPENESHGAGGFLRPAWLEEAMLRLVTENPMFKLPVVPPADLRDMDEDDPRTE